MKPEKRPARTKYGRVEILLATEHQQAYAYNQLILAPLDPLRPLRFVIEEVPIDATPEAKRYYWKRVGEIAAQAWFDNRQFNSDTWHEYLKRHIMQDIITDKKGIERSKWIEGPRKEMTVVSINDLDKASLYEYTQLVEVFGAELHVKFSANPREGR